MADYSDAQRVALERARSGADLMLAGRRARDRSIREALETGLSERAVAEGIGRNVDGSWIVSPAAVHRARKAVEE